MRDPTPSLIVSPSGMLRGCIWVSGLFDGFNTWCRDKKVGLTINALAQGGGEYFFLWGARVDLKENRILNRASFTTLSNQCSPCIPFSPSNSCSPGGVILDMDSRGQPAESFWERVETCVRKIG